MLDAHRRMVIRHAGAVENRVCDAALGVVNIDDALAHNHAVRKTDGPGVV
jgi:hypothetical protein